MFKAAKTVDFLFLTYYTDGSKQRKRLSSLIRLYFPLYLSRRSVSFSALRTERPINFLCRRRAAEWMIVMEKFDSLIIGEVAQDTNVDFDGTVVQAVGGAVGHNSISLIIPCHRVVGTNGSLTGYAGGISKKIELLTLEQVDMTNLFVPKKGTAL